MMEGFGIARLVLSLFILGGVVSFVAVRHRMRQKWDQNKNMKHRLREEMEKAHACHHSCGADATCHSTCPRPWQPFLKACHDLPKIKECRSNCKGTECEKCPKFDMEWINKKFDANPELAAAKGAEKCQKLENAHACHQVCKLGDHECHHSCPPMFDFHHKGHHHGDHHDHHHRDDHNDHFHSHQLDHHHDHHDRDFHAWHHHDHHHDRQDMNLKASFQQEMEKAHACHYSCGADATCHSNCVRPWQPFLKACHDLPEITKCWANCKGAECEACPKFDMDWMNKKFNANPELAAAKGEEKCHELEKVHACHQACALGDHKCHHSCPSMFDFHHKGHYHGHHSHHYDHRDAAEWHNDHEGNDQSSIVV